MAEQLPVLKARQVVACLEKAGFFKVRQSGSHAIYRKGTLTVTVPMHAGDMKRGTLGSILRQARLTPDDLKRLLS